MVNSDEFSIRVATKKDKELFISMGFLLRDAEGVPVQPGEEKHYRKRFADFIDNWYWKIFFAELNDKPVGFVTFKFLQPMPPKKHKTCFVQHLFVLKEYRTRGYGKLMMSWLEDICITEGATQVELFVLERNEQAHQFYKTVGYADELIQMRKHL